MDKQEIGKILSHSLNDRFYLEEKRNNLYQLFVPIFHDDGDMLDIYIDLNTDDGSLTICDYGKTLMRLSYTFDINTPRQEKILNSIIRDNGGFIDDGNISIKSSPKLLFENVMQLSQIISQVEAMKYTKRHSSKNLFYEDIDNYIGSNLQSFNPQKNILPIPSRDDLTVDYKLVVKDKPIFLFGILGNDKALSSVISILSFQQKKIPFTSIAVHSNYNALSQSTQKKIMNAADKQFFDFNSFCDTALDYLEHTAV